ncbi:B12 binding domain protein [compost metagenome]
MKVSLLGICKDLQYVDEELGVSYIASVLRQRGFKVEIKMCSEESIDYESILDFEPKMIGVSVYSTTYVKAQEISRTLKKRSTAYICWGGYFSSEYSVELLTKNEYIDFICSGEGEENFVKLVEYIAKGEAINQIPGLVYRNADNVPVKNEQSENMIDFNSLPFPSRDILRQHKIKAAKILFSRRSYSNKGSSEIKVRHAKNIVDEIEYIVNTYKVNRFDVLDHGFENEEYIQMLNEFTEEIERRNLKIYYYMYVTADFHDRVSVAFIERLKKSGLCGVFIDMETGNEMDRILYGKAVSIENYQRTLEYLHQNALHTSISFMNFNPYSTFESLKMNASFLSEYHIISSFFIFQSLSISKKSPLYERVLVNGLLREHTDFYEFSYSNNDKRIGVLKEFMISYYDVYGIQSSQYSKLCYFAIDYLNLISYLKKEFCNNSQVLKIIKDNEFLIYETLREIGSMFLEWFKSLLRLVENKWNYEQALLISQDLLDFSILNAKINSLDKYKSKLVINLFRLNSHYVDFL